MKIWYSLLPMIECTITNTSIRKQSENTFEKLKKEESILEIDSFKKIKESDAEYLLKGVRENITSLQDKAKVTAVAVTLAFSLVGGISSYLINLKDKFYINEWIPIILVFFVISSCFYLIIAGYYSLLTLNSRAKYDFSSTDFIYLSQLKSNENEEKLIMMGTQYKLTSYQNIMLNNYVDCSNNNLRNALISLGIFFSLICISLAVTNNNPIQLENQSKIMSEQTELIKIIHTDINTIQEDIVDLKNADTVDKTELYSIIDNLNSLLEDSLIENGSNGDGN